MCHRPVGMGQDRPKIGGNIGLGGFIPVVVPGVFPNGLPAIATAAVLGILMNLIFLIFPSKKGAM